MRKIVVATQNTGKLKELRYILRDWPVELLSLDDVGLADIEIEETGRSFEANALQKAQAVKAHTEYMVLSDDSGLCVDALNGEPGIYSARFGGDVDFAEKRAMIIDLTRFENDRRAFFVCAVALIDEEGNEVVAEARLEGQVAREERGEHGFGYDAIFQIEDGRTFGEVEFEEKHGMSHRFLAVQELREKLKDDPNIDLFR